MKDEFAKERVFPKGRRTIKGGCNCGVCHKRIGGFRDYEQGDQRSQIRQAERAYCRMTIKDAARMALGELANMPTREFWKRVDRAAESEEAVSLAQFLGECE